MDEEKRFSGLTGKEYDLVIQAHPHFPALQGEIGRILCSHLINKTGSLRVLEIGCGDGYTTQLVLQCGRNIRLVAIDNEPVMLKAATVNLVEFMAHNELTLIEADALAFLDSQESSSFDAIISAATFHNWYADYRHCVLAQTLRVLCPQGVFINADKYYLDSRKHNRELQARFRRYFDVFGKINRFDVLQEWVMHELEDANPDRIMSYSETLSFLERIGYKDVELTNTMSLESVLSAYK